MEVLHPSAMHGVFTQSSYRTDSYTRSRNALGYILRSTFGDAEAATGVIDQVEKTNAALNKRLLPAWGTRNGRQGVSARLNTQLQQYGRCWLIKIRTGNF